MPQVRARCRRILGSSSAAEDVVQETFYRLWLRGPKHEADAASVASWLKSTSTRLAIDALRAHKRAVASEAAHRASETPRPDDVLAARAALDAVRAVAPPEEIEATLLCRVDGLTHPEAARELGVSERTVRRLLARFDERTARLRAAYVAPSMVVHAVWVAVGVLLALTMGWCSEAGCASDRAVSSAAARTRAPG